MSSFSTSSQTMCGVRVSNRVTLKLEQDRTSRLGLDSCLPDLSFINMEQKDARLWQLDDMFYTVVLPRYVITEGESSIQTEQPEIRRDIQREASHSLLLQRSIEICFPGVSLGVIRVDTREAASARHGRCSAQLSGVLLYGIEMTKIEAPETSPVALILPIARQDWSPSINQRF
ncbi:hypothetical protein RRG08_020103 [Elysia crispata]|uniref:Uncharacterized protein n=1 Tax=Elysia crispata TaxID=231223 RepID=A0AAE1A552_9GAST|nr:hypothetical protein RRG08_020103 [Elysia crispata]